MKKSFIIFFLFLCLILGAQEEIDQQAGTVQQTEGEQRETIEQQEETVQDDVEDIDWNLDSLFENVSADDFEEPEEIKDNGPINLRDKITVEVDYGLIGGFAPGWSEAPWYRHSEEQEYSYVLGARLEALLNLDFSLTDRLRVHNAVYFAVPEEEIFSIREFYFEYDFWNKAYLRAGLYEIAWGISRFYPFTNLPALVPPSNIQSKRPGDSYIARLTFPIGIGGLELVGMTRYGFVNDAAAPDFDEIALGMKYNFAFEAADIDAGVLYHKKLPVRSFISVKTTLGNTELYTEGLVAVPQEKNPDVRGSGNLGFARDFFNGKLTLTGEIFYNGESNSAWWRSETGLLEESTVKLHKGLNGALAFIVRPGILGMRIFTQALYTYKKESIWLVPGISIRPGGINITLSVPMALGKRTDPGDTSNYYRNNDDKDDRPFSIVLGVTFNGKLRYTL